MNIITTPINNQNLLDLIEQGVKEFIVYYHPLSIKNASKYTLDEFKEAVEITNNRECKLYLGLTKILHNRDLAELDKVIDEVKDYDFEGIIYSDFAVYQTIKEKDLCIDLFYDGDMLATNSYTISLINDKKVFLSKELYFEEIEGMTQKLDGDVVIHAQGLIGMFHSVRPLVTNYKDYLNKEIKTQGLKNSLYDEERDLYYPILEDEKGSFIMGGNEVSLIDQIDLLTEIGVTTLKIDGFMQDENYLLSACKVYLEAIDLYQANPSEYKNSKQDYQARIEKISKRPLDKGFFFKPTMYKVKK